MGIIITITIGIINFRNFIIKVIDIIRIITITIIIITILIIMGYWWFIQGQNMVVLHYFSFLLFIIITVFIVILIILGYCWFIQGQNLTVLLCFGFVILIINSKIDFQHIGANNLFHVLFWVFLQTIKELELEILNALFLLGRQKVVSMESEGFWSLFSGEALYSFRDFGIFHRETKLANGFPLKTSSEIVKNSKNVRIYGTQILQIH